MPATKTKILIIEDDQTLIEMYKTKFIEEGFDVACAEDGLAGLEAAKKNAPHIILLDVIMPELDGFMVLEELKKDAKTKNIPVILLSNLGQESDREKGKKLGAIDYCVKADFTPNELVERVRKYLQ